jgi:hypothetical protein
VDLALEPAPVQSGCWRSERRQDLRHVAGRRARPRPRAAFNCIHPHRHHHHPFAAACAEVRALRWRLEPTASGIGGRVARARGVYVEQGPRSALPRNALRSEGNAFGHCFDAVAEALMPTRAEPPSDRSRRTPASRGSGHPKPAGRSLSAGQAVAAPGRAAAAGWRTGRHRHIAAVAYEAGQAGLTQRVCSDGCAPAAARIAASAAGSDRPCPRPGHEAIGQLTPELG